MQENVTRRKGADFEADHRGFARSSRGLRPGLRLVFLESRHIRGHMKKAKKHINGVFVSFLQ
jgi:hypothetical protein